MAMAADGRGRPRMAVEIAAVGRQRKLPGQLPRTSAEFRGDCRVAVAIAADGRGNCRGLLWVAMIGKTEFTTDRTAARAVATAVAFAVEMPWSVALAVETHGFPR